MLCFFKKLECRKFVKRKPNLVAEGLTVIMDDGGVAVIKIVLKIMIRLTVKKYTNKLKLFPCDDTTH